MKKIINNPEDIVDQMLDGLVKANKDKIIRIEDTNVIARKDTPVEGKVGLISGGGSGHEPAHAGFVGRGMLDCAVAGDVFTSPTPDQVLEAIKKADSGKGVFMVIKNYQGDVMNFEMAKEMAEMEDIEVEYVIVNDDIVVENKEDRRGVAGTVFVHKTLGAMAENGASLAEIKKAADAIVEDIKSIGMATKPCTNPSDGKESFELAENELEMGIGIHGEEGIQKEEMKSADEIVKEMVDRLLEEVKDLDSEYALLINGMGATPEMELYVISNSLHDYLEEKKVKVVRSYIGNFMTSMDMAGFSITLYKVDEDRLKLLDQEVDIVRK
ncbi:MULTISPECIES: dihydroxyacetone kinase subunit DhaK [Anaerococcus]|jgi:dihydroxyacetone kinase, dhaK subunit|uniref:Dihydroxyacetone kinase subunit DhaK n=1 Tax=Anaerococcus nagyae TaxID=1755241 RepID=A0A3E2TKL6_9FIRM|nr:MULTISPECIES: dihydroxyacetone kinase subunit DhaK [Anaerococcus]MDU2353407.1 dihydroxyacetone kinase subunit DhaK [Anaerococcus sp.]RGB77918.1 dihydroxyacetone kinase subunit DhaK [Anaerococcus nagyae]